MSWSTPKTWSNEPLVASDMNTYISDNLSALKEPPIAVYNADEGSDRTTASTSFTNVDGTDTEGVFRHTLTISDGGARVMVGFIGSVRNSTNPATIYMNVSIDGTDVAANDGLFAIAIGFATATFGWPANFVYLSDVLTAGSHIIRLRWKVSTGTATLLTGAGTASLDIHPQFWVREV